MRTNFAIVALWLSAGAVASESGRGPVLVELFTSQGCASCPPADRILAEIADRPDVIALSLHVDYWDYLGWKDAFGSSLHTERQRAYAALANERMVYTPQVVIQGRERLVGSRKTAVLDAIALQATMRDKAKLAITRRGDQLIVEVSPVAGGAANGFVTMAWYSSAESVSITAGENAGREALFRNVVLGWSNLGEWAGKKTSFTVETPVGADAVVVMVQAEDSGEILCSWRIMLN